MFLFILALITANIDLYLKAFTKNHLVQNEAVRHIYDTKREEHITLFLLNCTD